MNATDLVDRAHLRDDIPEFAPGDTLKVHVRVVEGNRERVQVFQGVVIRRKGSGIRETFTVRKVSFGVGVERTFPVHSPIVAKIEVVTRGDVRRAKLYYLRDRVGKAAKVKEKRRPDRSLRARPYTAAQRNGRSGERRRPRAVRDRDRAPALQGVSRRPADVRLRRRDRAALLPHQRGEAGRPQRARARSTSSSSCSDAWVWDMYRPARFVANVRVVTFKDVNIEELAGRT